MKNSKSRDYFMSQLHNPAMDVDQFLMDLYAFQLQHNLTYQKFVYLLYGSNYHPKAIHEIPHLPISFFKKFQVQTGDSAYQKVFRSSGTTGQVRSQHFVKDVDFYQTHALNIFQEHYGSIQDYTIAAILPGYQERNDSSLIAMIDFFIKKSNNPSSGYYLEDTSKLLQLLKAQEDKNEKTILFGVSFALLQLWENENIDIKNTIIIETGGMKGKGPDWTKEKLHVYLQNKFGMGTIHTEYGMTELLSQAYGEGNFIKINKYLIPSVVDITDPLTPKGNGTSGILRFIDLANIDSCSFIQTEDVGIIHDNGTFSIQGRLDFAEWRGCNLLVQDLL